MNATNLQKQCTIGDITGGNETLCGMMDEDEELWMSADEEPTTTLIRGKAADIASTFLLTPHEFLTIIKAVLHEILIHWEDLILIALFTYGPIMVTRCYYQYRHGAEFTNDQFQKSKAFRRAQLVSEGGKVFALIYILDLLLLMLQQFQVSIDPNLGVWLMGIVFFIWAARCLSVMKHCYIVSLLPPQEHDVTRNTPARIANRFLDVVIYGATILAILDLLSIETGFALKSLFGLSSAGTLVVSLASRELMAEFLASLAIQGNNMYKTGDQIWLGEWNAQGTVQKAGWLHTQVRMPDETVVQIPNTKIAGTRMANVSRHNLSQVLQTLCLSYEDWKKFPKLRQDIKEEIQASCPEVIADGSRPFRAQFDSWMLLFMVLPSWRSLIYYRLKRDSPSRVCLVLVVLER